MNSLLLVQKTAILGGAIAKDTGSMAPRKLSDSDKGTITELYKQPEQTTSTLAEQYGVSNSTISRILKTTLPAEEYSELISQKRMAGSDKSQPAEKKVEKKARTAKKAKPKAAKAQLADDATDDGAENIKPKLKTTAEKDEEKTSTTPSRRRRTRSRKESEDEQLPLLSSESASSDSDDDDGEGSNAPEKPVKAAKPVQKPQVVDSNDDDDDDDDDLLGLDETLGDDFGDDDDELEDDESDDDDSIEVPKPKLQPTAAMSIMPLAEAVLPKPCYLVVDTRSELITCPLSEFADLGQIPNEEERSKTLPVFDNHRVARRFSRNKQRVIKVPDGDLITRTSPYLEAKGITRLLVDGQVFALSGR